MRWSTIAVLGLLACSSERKGGKDRSKVEARGEEARPVTPLRPDEGRERTVEIPADFKAERTVSAPQTVVFIVIDTVRADHMSLCGYERPTTPFLQKLTQEKDAAVACRAYSPGTWTTPSHASYFTGAAPTEHHLLNKGHPLGKEFETLAESFVGAGWQTALVAANPTLGQATGIWQGFQHAAAAEGLYKAWRGNELVEQVEKTLKKVEKGKPLFLFVNIFDAHDPYPAVPDGVEWLPRREKMDILPNRPDAYKSLKEFYAGTIEPKTRGQLVAHMNDSYDYGVYKSDQDIQRVLGLLEAEGWLSSTWRVVITSDHGEHLGEHDMMRHDGPPFEAVSRVPLVFMDNSVPKPVLPSPISATAAYWLVKDGKLPAEMPPVMSASIQYEDGDSFTQFQDAVAIWRDEQHKLFWSGGKLSEVDLVADPKELALKPATANDPAVDRHVQALLKSKQIALGEAKDPEVMRMLEAVGYVN
jgi:hypothetical protein